MPTCVIHIGMPKAGSTSIQSACCELDNDRFYYANIFDRPNHGLNIRAAFAEPGAGSIAERAQKGRRQMAIEKLALQTRDELTASIGRAGGRTLIISGEDIVFMPAADLSRLQDFLAAHSYDCRIIAYVRAPASFVNSMFQHGLRNGRYRDLDLSAVYPHYRKHFESFDQVFGADNVNLRKFAPSSFTGQDVVVDFAEQVGIDPAALRPSTTNEAWSKGRLCLYYQCRHRLLAEGVKFFDPRGLKRLRGLDSIDPSKMRLSPKLLAPLLAANGEDIAWMENRMGQSLGEAWGEEQPDDIRSEADLLRPIPGAHDRLVEILRKLEACEKGDEKLETHRLLLKLSQLTGRKARDSRARQRQAERRRSRAARAA